MAESLKKNVNDAHKAKAFIEFEYTEVKDLSKQLLTVVTAVLALSVTFSEKVLNVSQSQPFERYLLIASWGLCLIAFILGGNAILMIYNAGFNAKQTELYEEKIPYELFARKAYISLNTAGVLFGISLFLIVISAILTGIDTGGCFGSMDNVIHK